MIATIMHDIEKFHKELGIHTKLLILMTFMIMFMIGFMIISRIKQDVFIIKSIDSALSSALQDYEFDINQ